MLTTWISIFTGKKLEDLSPSTHNMEVPNLTRIDYTVLDIDDSFLNLMGTNGEVKADVKLPEGELGTQIQQGIDADKEVIVSVLTAMGEEAVVKVTAS